MHVQQPVGTQKPERKHTRKSGQHEHTRTRCRGRVHAHLRCPFFVFARVDGHQREVLPPTSRL